MFLTVSKKPNFKDKNIKELYWEQQKKKYHARRFGFWPHKSHALFPTSRKQGTMLVSGHKQRNECQQLSWNITYLTKVGTWRSSWLPFLCWGNSTLCEFRWRVDSLPLQELKVSAIPSPQGASMKPSCKPSCKTCNTSLGTERTLTLNILTILSLCPSPFLLPLSYQWPQKEP